MKYYVIYTANGELAISNITEFTEMDKAKAKFHDVAKLMWSDASVETAFIVILDSQMNVAEGYREAVIKVQPEPEQNEE